MCKCKDIEFGSYDRQTSMLAPFEIKDCLGEKKGNLDNQTWVCVDTCLVQEIAELWALGIKTIECCCGHNKNDGYVAVDKKYAKQMKKLGYKSHPSKPNDEEFYLPLSV